MKRFELKSYTVGRGDNAEELPAAELMGLCVNHTDPTKGGLTLREMRKRNRVLDHLEGVDDDATHVDMEDADAATLQECVEAMQWAMVSTGIIAFGDDVKNAKSPPKKARPADEAA